MTNKNNSSKGGLDDNQSKELLVTIKDSAARNPSPVEAVDLHEVTFNSLPIPDWLLSTLTKLKYQKPTTIQEKAIPLAVEGRDILASSQTGSGKTIAFSVPVMIKLSLSESGSCLVLAPTRELADQIKKVMQDLQVNKKFGTVLLVGGESIFAQIKQLKANPRIIIATPGRLLDHVKRKSINLSEVNTLVLDEFDRMLEMGFKEDLEIVFKDINKERQILMFSATTRESVIKLAYKNLYNPVEIKIGAPKEQNTNVKQEFNFTSHSKKYDTLLEELEKRHGSIIIFTSTKRGAEDLCDRLEEDGKPVDVIHGDLQQRKRDRVIKSFRAQKFEILVATDVVSRGIDIPHVMHVINYDLPQCLEDYNHRIGRSGRDVNIEGAAVSLICLPSDQKKYNNIKMKLNSDEMEKPTFGKKGGRSARSSSGNDRYQRRDFNSDRQPRFDKDRPSKNYNSDRPQFKRDRDEASFNGDRQSKPNREFNRDDRFNKQSRFDNSNDKQPRFNGDNERPRFNGDNERPRFNKGGSSFANSGKPRFNKSPSKKKKYPAS